MADAPHPSASAIIDLYRRHAADWIRRRGPFFEDPWIERFLALAPANASVLDLGCGSGTPMADGLIARGATVTGVDASAPLLDHARNRHGPPHRWIEADMRGLDLGETFDGALAWHSVFHLTPDDQTDMFAVYRRHVRPGGLLMFTSGDCPGETIGEWQGEPLYHASLHPDAYEALLEGHGFQVVAHVDAATSVASIWLARRG